MLEKVKTHLRVKATTGFDEEVQGLIAACISDLKRVGIVIDPAPYLTPEHEEDAPAAPAAGDPLIERAIILYSKANFGYTADVDAKRFADAYDNLARALVLSGDYNGARVEENEDGMDG